MTGKIQTWFEKLNPKQRKELLYGMLFIILGEGITIGYIIRDIIDTLL